MNQFSDYNQYFQNFVFWDNNEDYDKDGNQYLGDGPSDDENIAFYSKRIQKFQKFSAIQRECLNNQLNSLYNIYNNSHSFGGGNHLFPSNQKTEADDRIKMMTELLENDKNTKYIDDEYYFEKDNKKN